MQPPLAQIRFLAHAQSSAAKRRAAPQSQNSIGSAPPTYEREPIDARPIAGRRSTQRPDAAPGAGAYVNLNAGLSNDSGPNLLPQTERHRAHRTHVGAYGGASQRRISAEQHYST